MSALEKRMAELRARFAIQAQQEAAELELRAAAGDWRAVAEIAHGLAGRAGMFGFPEIGNLARDAEEAIDAGGAPRSDAAELAARLRALDQGR